MLSIPDRYWQPKRLIISTLVAAYYHLSRIYHYTKLYSFWMNCSISHVALIHKIILTALYIRLDCNHPISLVPLSHEGALAYTAHVIVSSLNELTHQC